jgi:hypothetical protein
MKGHERIQTLKSETMVLIIDLFRNKIIQISLIIIFITDGIEQSVQWLATGWMAWGFEFESWQRQDFSPVHVIQAGSEAHPASYPISTSKSFLGGKEAGA